MAPRSPAADRRVEEDGSGRQLGRCAPHRSRSSRFGRRGASSSERNAHRISMSAAGDIRCFSSSSRPRATTYCRRASSNRSRSASTILARPPPPCVRRLRSVAGRSTSTCWRACWARRFRRCSNTSTPVSGRGSSRSGRGRWRFGMDSYARHSRPAPPRRGGHTSIARRPACCTTGLATTRCRSRGTRSRVGTARWLPSALVDAASLAAERYDSALAEQLLDQAITLTDDVDALLARARVRIARWDIAGARLDTQKALELGSGRRRSRLRHGRSTTAVTTTACIGTRRRPPRDPTTPDCGPAASP